MIKCMCKTSLGDKIEYAYNVNELTDDCIKRIVDNNDIVSRKDKTYINDIITFDIETSTIRDLEKPYAFLYIWQACFCGDVVVMGRTWQECKDFFNRVARVCSLGEGRLLPIYVHNLPFEFHFMQDFFTMTNVFATDNHKVLKATMNNCFELRCSYYLSNMSLSKFISNTPNALYIKAVGDLDYKEVRTPLTILSDVEYGYCYNDVRGLYEAVHFLLQEDNVIQIPMTSTGYVRRDCRRAMNKNKDNRKIFNKTSLDLEQYFLCKECFRGGNTASNRKRCNKIYKTVSSYDITSSYPFVMLTEKFPMGKFMRLANIMPTLLRGYNNKYCTMGRYTFTGLKVKENNIPIPYIPYSKCTEIGSERVIYNGRILEANLLTISLTNIDFEIIENQYTYDKLFINDFYYCYKDYLPIELTNQILKYYRDKTELKGVKDKEYEYNKSKNKLNSIYGMCVTDIIREAWEYEDDIFIKNAHNKTSLDDYYESFNSFLVYQWGVWVTAYARKNLQNMLDVVGDDVIYCDTDSIKYINNYDKEFNECNNSIINRVEREGLEAYCDYKGKRMYLGVWTKEETYDDFVTMGAKKYAYNYSRKLKINDSRYAYIKYKELGITVSGLSKSKGAKELTKKGGLTSFKIGTVFFDSGRTDVKYNVEKPHIIEVEGCKIETASNIAILDTTYTLGMTDTMYQLLENYKELE